LRDGCRLPIDSVSWQLSVALQVLSLECGGWNEMATRERSILVQFYDSLRDAFGPQHWWPADTATEVAIGAVLTQNTAWRNVERAIAALQNAELIDFRRLDALPEVDLAELIRPAGPHRVKARRLKALARWVCERGEGDLAVALAGKTPVVRHALLRVHGIGPETADAILLYAGGHCSFVVDTYTRRILRRHHLIDDQAEYATIQALFEEQVARRAQVYNEYHALLVELGKRHCRAKALCAGCPLESWPHDPDAA
jgi:endonuclease-3 related protein